MSVLNDNSVWSIPFQAEASEDETVQDDCVDDDHDVDDDSSAAVGSAVDSQPNMWMWIS